MARELGMNAKKLGGLDDQRQERWKLPLPLFIEELYRNRFGRARPEFVLSIEEHARKQASAFTGRISPTVPMPRSLTRRPAAASFSSSTCQPMRSPP